MKRFILFPVILLCVSTGVWSQGHITLENGQRIAYEKIKISAASFQVTRLVNGKKVKEKILVDSIQSYEELVTTYYKKPNPIEGASRKFDFVQRDVIGKINVYTKTESSYVSNGQYGGYTFVNNFVYLEKGARYECVVISNTLIKNKKKHLEVLESFVEDDPEITAKIKNGDFKFNSESIVQIIKDYNLNSLKKKN